MNSSSLPGLAVNWAIQTISLSAFLGIVSLLSSNSFGSRGERSSRHGLFQALRISSRVGSRHKAQPTPAPSTGGEYSYLGRLTSVSIQIFAARMAFALQTLVQLKCFLWRFVLMHYGPHCLNHGHGSFRLKDVSPHVNTGRSLVYGFVGHA